MLNANHASVFFTNARSVLNKSIALSSAVDSCSADIVILTETWLSAKMRNNEILNCEKSYCFYRYDKGIRSGGGVLIAANEVLVSHVIPVVSSLELVCVRVHIASREFIICVCYRPPSAARTFCNDFQDVLNKLIVRYPKSPLLILGDFNFPDIIGRQDSVVVKHNTSECLEFVNLCCDFNLTQLVHLPTQTTGSTANILDLILTSKPELISTIRNKRSFHPRV